MSTQEVSPQKKITTLSDFFSETHVFKNIVHPFFLSIRPSSKKLKQFKEIAPLWIGEEGKITTFLLFILQLFNSIILWYNIWSIPFIIAFESYWHIGLKIFNISTDILYFFSILILEARLLVFFLILMFGKRFLKLIDKILYFFCCFRWIPLFGKIKQSYENRKKRKVSQYVDIQVISRPSGIGGSPSPSIISKSPASPAPAPVSAPAPASSAPASSAPAQKMNDLIVTDLLSKNFKLEFHTYWERYLVAFYKDYLFTPKFLADLVMFFFIDWFFTNVPWVRIGKFFAAAIRFNSQLESVLKKLNFRSSSQRVIRLLFLLVTLFHIYACVFYFVSSLPGKRDEVGIIPAEALKLPLLRGACMSRQIYPDYNTDRFKQYSCSLYFSIVFLVGYQDVTPPQGFYQACYSVAYVLAGSMLFATMVGTVSALIRTIDVNGFIYQEKIENVKGFMRERRISNKVRQNVSRYYEILRKTRRDISVRDVFYDLDLDLYKNITLNLYKDLLMNIDIFKKCNNDFFISDVCQLLDYLLLLDGFDILQEEDVGMCMYIINSGKVKVYHKKDDGSEVEYAILGPGNLIGELSFVSDDQLRNASCRPITSVVELITLQYDPFYLLLERYPECKTIIFEGLIERKRKFARMNIKMEQKFNSAKRLRNSTYVKSFQKNKKEYESDDNNTVSSQDSGRKVKRKSSVTKLAENSQSGSQSNIQSNSSSPQSKPHENISTTSTPIQSRRRSQSVDVRALSSSRKSGKPINEKRNVQPLSIIIPETPLKSVIEEQSIGITPLLGNLHVNASPLSPGDESSTFKAIQSKKDSEMLSPINKYKNNDPNVKSQKIQENNESVDIQENNNSENKETNFVHNNASLITKEMKDDKLETKEKSKTKSTQVKKSKLKSKLEINTDSKSIVNSDSKSEIKIEINADSKSEINSEPKDEVKPTIEDPKVDKKIEKPELQHANSFPSTIQNQTNESAPNVQYDMRTPERKSPFSQQTPGSRSPGMSPTLSPSLISPFQPQNTPDERLDELRRIMGIHQPKSPSTMIVKRQSKRVHPDMAEEISRTAMKTSIGLNDPKHTRSESEITSLPRPIRLTLPPVSPTRSPLGPSPVHSRRSSLVLSNSLVQDLEEQQDKSPNSEEEMKK